MSVPPDNFRRRMFIQTAFAAAAGAGMALTAPSAIAGGFLGNLLGTDVPSIGEQKKLGDKAAQDILKQYKEVHDARATHFNTIGQRLIGGLSQKDQSNWDFRYHVLDSDEANAFALPGGNMFLFTGLYKNITTDDALAAVTGHEMTHVRKQHWAKAYAQENQRGLAMLLGAIVFKAGEGIQDVAGLSNSLYTLKYSRGEEDQADQGGLEDMVAAGFNPEGMIQLFDTLQRLSGDGGGPAFLSDHPLTKDRIKRTEDRIAALQKDHTFPPLTPLDYAALIGH
jgi:predicted Zn-dependent protease